jgi:uncharacterized membrane protein YhhN
MTDMSILKLKENGIKTTTLSACIVFALGLIAFFTPVEIPHKVTIPVAILTIASIWLCPWQITLALLFSAIGDYFGSCENFLGQMGCFAVAHIWFIIYFIGRYLKRVEHDKKLTPKAKGYLGMVIFCTASLLAIAFFKIAPGAEPGIIRTGVCIYACLIGAMMFLALLQRSSLFALGAVLFVFSDFILAWNIFVEPVPYSQYLIMVPYFLAQWLLFIRATPYRVAPEMRIMRF